MSTFPATPIIIGVGDVANRSTAVKDAKHPAQLMLEAISNALADTQLPTAQQAKLQARINSIDVVNTWTWSYPDLPKYLARELNVSKAKHTKLSEHGGNSPGLLLDNASRRIARREADVAVVTGGEALATYTALAKTNQIPPPGWPQEHPTIKSIASGGIKLPQTITPATPHKIGIPVQVYPLYENGFRARRGQSIRDNASESAELYGQFARVAERNPYSWNYGKPAASDEFIGTPSPKNRMICTPYTLLMNAFNNVNLAAACILTNVEVAKELGIPESRWVFPLGGAGYDDCDEWWLRQNFHSSPAIERSIDEAVQNSNIQKNDLSLFDFYSCFPIVPKLAGAHLGLPLDGSSPSLTLLGGLTSFGGAGNNYSMHGFTAMTRRLRESKAKTAGLVLANGGLLSHQHAVVLSNRPPTSSYVLEEQASRHLHDVQSPEIAEHADGPAAIESYTVEYSRDGKPTLGFVIGRLTASDARFIANHGDQDTLRQLASAEQEPIGRGGTVVSGKDGRNLFSFGSSQARL